eukprot:scaffold115385_cov19-Tisochrysis_lutea.AAC.1
MWKEHGKGNQEYKDVMQGTHRALQLPFSDIKGHQASRGSWPNTLHRTNMLVQEALVATQAHQNHSIVAAPVP